jgi:hypothetical protein
MGGGLSATSLGSGVKMKNRVVVFVLFLLFMACSNNAVEYPNIDTKSLSAQLKWDMNYNSVKSILTDNIQLRFSKKIPQMNSEGTVYEYLGGKYHNYATHSWVVAFESDSLRMVSIKIAKEQPADNEIVYNQLIEQFNSELASDTVDESDSNKWYVKNNDNIISEVLISMTTDKTGIAIIFSKPVTK